MSKRWWFNVITFSVGVLTLLVCGWIINPMLVAIEWVAVDMVYVR